MISDLPGLIPLYKPLGMTPLQLVRQFALENSLSPSTGYAGRLDPLADGVLLGLFGSTNAQQSQLLGLEKAYLFKAVFGLTTDSYDLMGLPTAIDRLAVLNPMALRHLTSSMHGSFEQPYPAYSAVRVNSRPLFYWARVGKLNEIDIPTAQRTIYSFAVKDTTNITSIELLYKINHDIELVKGDFRQAEIVAKWHETLSNRLNESWPTASFEVRCSSGTYIRSLVDMIGRMMALGATTLSLTRTAVGPFTLKDCQSLNDSTA
jgi:tRNA pseudouridine55 synthase